MILAYLAIPLELILYFCLKPFDSYKKIKNYRHTLWTNVFWNGTLKTVKSTYTIMCIAVCINLKYVSLAF